MAIKYTTPEVAKLSEEQKAIATNKN